jgi:hypothetical protein
MNKTEFIALTMNVLNEADADMMQAELTGADMTQLETYIEKMWGSVWKKAVNLFPVHWFTPVSFADAPIKGDGPDGTGYVVLPNDFLKLISFRMKGWKNNVTTLRSETEDENRRQTNEYTRGNANRPVCVLRWTTHENELSKAIYYYSLPRMADATDHVVNEALYISNINLDEETEINDIMGNALAHLAAATVLYSMEKADQAKVVENEMVKMI